MISFHSISIALQVAGAIELLIRYWGNIENNVLKEYYSKSSVAIRNDKNEVKLEKEKLQDAARDVYLTRISIMYIVIGYAIDFVESSNGSKMIISTTLFTCCLIAFGYFTAKHMAKWKYKTDRFIQYNELKRYVDVDTVMTSAEVDEIIKEILPSDSKR